MRVAHATIAMFVAVVVSVVAMFFYYDRVANPRIAREITEDPDGERAPKVMLVRLPSVVPLPSAVPVTCLPTSMRRTWFPPKALTHTGRLCSAGSGVPVRSPTSKLLCSPPALLLD